MEFLPPHSPIVLGSFDGSNSVDSSNPFGDCLDSDTIYFFHDERDDDGVFTTDALYRTVCQLYTRLCNIHVSIPEKDIPSNSDYKNIVKSSFDILQRDNAVPVKEIDRLVTYYTVRPVEFLGYFANELYRYFGCDTEDGYYSEDRGDEGIN